MYKILEFISEAVGFVMIVLSPLLIGAGIGAFIYSKFQNNFAVVIWVLLTILGLIIGILWANKVRKGRGTMFFLSRVMRTPELDNEDNDNLTKN